MFVGVRHNVTGHFAFHACPLQKDGVQSCYLWTLSLKKKEEEVNDVSWDFFFSFLFLEKHFVIELAAL